MHTELSRSRLQPRNQWQHRSSNLTPGVSGILASPKSPHRHRVGISVGKMPPPALPDPLTSYPPAVAFTLTMEASQLSMQPGYSPVGWYSRATPMPTDPPYKITGDNLAFAITISSLVKPRGLLAAFFKPNTAIDANGSIFALQENDWDALVQLAKATTSLPKSGENNIWEFEPFTTCPSTEWIHVATPNGLHATSIDAWGNEQSELVHPVGNITTLPDDLRLLLKYAYEGLNDFQPHIYAANGGLAVEREVMKLLNPDYSRL